MREFTPKSLIISVVAETESLNDYKPQLKFVQIEGNILGDEKRLKYITTCLIKNAISRNKEH